MAEATVEVKIDGQPATGVSVVLAPMSKGRPAVIAVGADGKGKGEAVVGENVVTVVPAPGASGGHSASAKTGIGPVFSSSDSPLKAKVEAKGPNTFTFEVGAKAGKEAAKSGRAGHGAHGS